MDLYLQFAHGMKQISIDLAKDWNGATVILSPRDIEPERLQTWSTDFDRARVKTLFDPQFYYPKSNHKCLIKYKYWDPSFSTKLGGGGSFEEELTKLVLQYNDFANTKEYIIPAAMLEYSDDWLQRWQRQSRRLVDATAKLVQGRKHILTLALPDTLLLQKEDEIERVIETVEEFDVNGCYIIAHPPQDKYLVDNPMWMVNLLQLCAGLKLQGKKVIMGYGNHQLLCLTAAKIDAMATGTYLNVRRFTNKFEEDDSILRKSVWYYYPAALSEYKLGFLDVAYNNGVLGQMKPPKEMDKGYVDILFAGAQPSSIARVETLFFKHYLNCVRIQAKNLDKVTYKDTISANEVLLETAMRRIEFMESHGVYAQARSFKDMVDVNRSALSRLQRNRGFQLQQEWTNL